MRPVGEMIQPVTNPIHAALQTALAGRTSPVRVDRSSDGRSFENPPDAVELSQTAPQESERPELEQIRADLVRRVREQIAEGTYLTDRKTEAAVERLSRVLLGDG